MEGKIINIRAIAILLVVIGHSIIIYDPTWGVMETSQTSDTFRHLKGAINFIQMKLFFSVSGYLMYYSMQRSKGFGKFLKNKTKRLLVPYCLIAIVWMDPIKMLAGVPGYDNILSLVKAQAVGENCGHLWYVIALFVIFAVTYWLTRLTDAITTWLRCKGMGKLQQPMLIAVFLILNVIPAPGTNLIQLNAACRYLPYFYFGYLLNAISHSHATKLNKGPQQLAAVGTCLLMLILYMCTSGRTATALLLSYALIATAYVVTPDRTNRAIDYVSQNSYGLYLLHSPLVYITYAAMPEAEPVVVFAGNFVVFGGIALVLTNYIRKTRLAPAIGG